MATYQWQWMRLYGTHWWTRGSSYSDHPVDIRASERKEKSEEKLTALLYDGWQITAIVPMAPDGTMHLDTPSIAEQVVQEAWSVFLQRGSADSKPGL